MSFVAYYEQYLYAGVYYACLALMPLLEMIFPLRRNHYPLPKRWFNNFLLSLVNTVVERFLVPVFGIAVAAYAAQHNWGLFHLLNIPLWVALLPSLLLLDYSRYLLHRLYHHFPLLWSFHKVHHSDPDYDFTTSFRFHPFEILIGLTVHLGLILLLGAPVLSIIILEILTVSVNFFVHGNIRLPAKLEKAIRCLVVTPDMHRVHHSTVEAETNSNYSIVFPYWDYLGRSFTPVNSVDHQHMAIGLDDCRGPRYLNILWLLALPFLGAKDRRIKP